MSQESERNASSAYSDAVTVLATALDRLGARIHRDLHVESSYIDLSSDPDLENTLTRFSFYADECLAVLDDPRVTAALAATRAHPER